MKEQEIRAKNRDQKAAALLDGVPGALPALVEAQQITSRAANVGFDWNNAGQVLEKLREELAEFHLRAPHRLSRSRHCARPTPSFAAASAMRSNN